MEWIYLIVAGLFEVTWAVGLKLTEGFSKIFPSIVTIAGMILSFVFLSLALKKLPLSIAYAILTGIGTMGTVIFGLYFFHESISLPHLICVGLILVGIIGLRIL